MLAVLTRLESEQGAGFAAKYPVQTRATPPDVGRWELRSVEDWRSGFFPGILWELYDHSDNPSLREAAIAWTEGIAALQDTSIDHDLGFRFISSFGAGLMLQRKQHDPDGVWRSHAEGTLERAAFSLDMLFNAGQIPVGALRAFPISNAYLAPYPVYIDSMMNLELPFVVWDLAGRPTSGPIRRLYDHAVTHASKVLAEHVRPNGSTYHIVQYEETPGPNAAKIHAKISDQGFAAESTWSRGQAWAIYGFTRTYHYTKNDAAIDAQGFIDAAKRAADWFIAHLPQHFTCDPYNHVPGDFVPPSDFDAALGEPVGPWNDANRDGILGDRRPGTKAFTARDSSAAAIAASALLELGTVVDEPELRDRYLGAAEDILHSLLTFQEAAGTLAYLAQDPSYEGLLLKGSTAYGSAQQSLSYGDRYFLEALRRCLSLKTRAGEVRRCGKVEGS